MQKMWSYVLTILLLHTISTTNSSSSIVPSLLPPTHHIQSCLLHFILQKQTIDQTYFTEEERLNDFISVHTKNGDVFLVTYSSYSSKNSSSDDEDSNDAETSTLLELSRIKWRGGECFRFLILNSKSITHVIKEPEVAFWKYSELPEILVFVPVVDDTDDNAGWNWESVVEMKEAGDFNGFKARIYFLQFHYSGLNLRKLGVLCYMCPGQSSINWVNADGKNIAKLRKLNGGGHKRNLYLRMSGTDLTNLEEKRNCELVMFFHKTKECGINTVLFEMIKTRLNLTAERVLDVDEVETSLSSSILILNDNPREINSLGVGKYEYFIRDQTIGKLFYCTKFALQEFEAVSWDIFLRSVAPEIWACILAIGVIYSIITKNVYLGFRAVLFLTGQGIQISLPLGRNKLFLTPLFPLVIVSICYLSLMTLDVVVPPSVSVIKENKQLLDLGYRMIIPSLDLLPVIQRMANKSLEKYGIPWDAKHFVANPDVVKFGEALQPEFLLALGQINGIYHTHKDLVLFMRKLNLLNPRSNKYGNVTCSVVEQDWDEISFTWLIQGYMSSEILDSANWLLEYGLHSFWTIKKHINSVNNMRLNGHCQDHAEICGGGLDVKGMSLQSSILIIFYFLIIFLSLAGISFGFEMMRIV